MFAPFAFFIHLPSSVFSVVFLSITLLPSPFQPGLRNLPLSSHLPLPCIKIFVYLINLAPMKTFEHPPYQRRSLRLRLKASPAFARGPAPHLSLTPPTGICPCFAPPPPQNKIRQAIKRQNQARPTILSPTTPAASSHFAHPNPFQPLFSDSLPSEDWLANSPLLISPLCLSIPKLSTTESPSPPVIADTGCTVILLQFSNFNPLQSFFSPQKLPPVSFTLPDRSPFQSLPYPLLFLTRLLSLTIPPQHCSLFSRFSARRSFCRLPSLYFPPRPLPWLHPRDSAIKPHPPPEVPPLRQGVASTRRTPTPTSLSAAYDASFTPTTPPDPSLPDPDDAPLESFLSPATGMRGLRSI